MRAEESETLSASEVLNSRKRVMQNRDGRPLSKRRNQEPKKNHQDEDYSSQDKKRQDQPERLFRFGLHELCAVLSAITTTHSVYAPAGHLSALSGHLSETGTGVKSPGRTDTSRLYR